MRFSSIFQLPTSQRSPAQEQHVLTQPAPAEFAPSDAAPLTTEVPDDLDQRVRMVGEWQLGEGY